MRTFQALGLAVILAVVFAVGALPAVAHADGGTWESIGTFDNVKTFRK